MQYQTTFIFTEDNTVQDINVDLQQLESQTQSQSLLKKATKGNGETSKKLGVPLKEGSVKRPIQSDKVQNIVPPKKSRLSLGPTTSKQQVIGSSRKNLRTPTISVDESSGLEELFGTPRVSSIKIRHDTSSSDASVFNTGNVLTNAKVNPKPSGQDDKDLFDVQLLSIQTSLCENVEKLTSNAERIAIACEAISNRVETGNGYWRSIAQYMDMKIQDHQKDVDNNGEEDTASQVQVQSTTDQNNNYPSDTNDENTKKVEQDLQKEDDDKEDDHDKDQENEDDEEDDEEEEDNISPHSVTF